MIVISGATGGVGGAVANEFARNGHDIILIGRNANKLDLMVKLLLDKYDVVVLKYICDINMIDSVYNVTTEISDLKSNIDVLVNAAGVFPYTTVVNTSTMSYDECMDVNVKMPFLLSKGLYNKLMADGGGKIINIGSSSSYSGFKNTVAYCASKHALLGLSRALNDEWKSSGVSVSCISPGTINTEMANVLDQDRTTYIEPHEFSEFVYDLSKYSDNMLIDEIRVNRRVVK